MIITRAPLRISFFGGGTDFPEYFVSHGGAVLATAIDKFSTTMQLVVAATCCAPGTVGGVPGGVHHPSMRTQTGIADDVQYHIVAAHAALL